VPEDELVLVVANASSTFGLATESSQHLRDDHGYLTIFRTVGLQEVGESVIFFSDGYEAEANRLADQIDLPRDRVEPRPVSGLNVEGDAPGQLVLVLGNDWEDITNLEGS
jgi:hypothetical protein